MKTSRRAAVEAAVIGFLLHTVAALWIWSTSDIFWRGNVITWLDFPVSVAYMHLDGTPLLVCSLLVGGLEWAGLAALLAFLLGQAARRRAG
jgi:hypothetical protein